MIYESLYTTKDGEHTVVIARGTKEHVERIAQISHFVPYTVRERQTEEEVRQMYWEFREKYGNHRPNRAIVKMYWEDGDNTEKGYQVDTVALKHSGNNLPSDDNEILFYAGNLKGLLELFEHNNGSDFVVTEVVQFYRHVE